jgi:hypothetical protein
MVLASRPWAPAPVCTLLYICCGTETLGESFASLRCDATNGAIRNHVSKQFSCPPSGGSAAENGEGNVESSSRRSVG